MIMDVSPGYDAHLVFPGSSRYGFTAQWRGWLVALWSRTYSGVVLQRVERVHEGFAGMRQQLSEDRDFAWLRRMFARA